MVAFDAARLRPQFPALALRLHGEPVVYLDGPGGTQVPQGVIDAVSAYYREANANTHGAFVTSERSDALLTEAHVAMADLLNATSPDEVRFGPNMTTLTFALSRALGRTLRPGDEVVVTRLDHDANVSPWRLMAEDAGATIRFVDIRDADCTLDLDSLDAALSERTRLVAVGYASNAVGTINPVAEIVRRAHAVGALTFVDAVHYAPHGPIDVLALETDFLACSIYKFFGPHVGALYARAERLAALPVYKLRPSRDGLETGTQNHEGLAGTVAALEYLAALGREQGGTFRGAFPSLSGRCLDLHAGLATIAAYERTLSERLVGGLMDIPGLRLWGIIDPARFAERTPTVALRLAGWAPRELAAELGRRGIFAWDGDFYATELIERLGLAESGGVVRLGLVHYNTPDEVDLLLRDMRELASRPPQ